jgi:alkanesulfonate monooxygenase SsuD/methylene tetrahydromethanopterin reductase-like flavin-dependent oxidoreductase (luciferase family)
VEGDEAGAARATHPWVAEGANAVRFGIANGPRGEWPVRRAFVELVEELGFDSYWASDHPLLGNECWTILAALAVSTGRLRLGALVSCVPYRNVVVLARSAADVHELSGGRLVLGLGIGAFPWEFEQMGIPAAPVAERVRLLDEALRVVPPLLNGEEVTFRGEHITVAGATLTPPPRTDPRVPILVGGAGERVTLRQVARYADVSNFGEIVYAGGVPTPAEVRRKYAVLRQHCERIGRPYGSILRSHTTYPLVLAATPAAVARKVEALPETFRRLAGDALKALTPDQAVDYYAELVAAGVRYFTVFIQGNDTETVQLLADAVVPRVAAGAPPATTE